MSCLNPITLKNPTRDFRPFDPLEISVPCGQCLACRDLEKRQWEVRIREQMHENERNGINNYFVTLTYNPETRPSLLIPSEEGYEKVNCFDKEHVKKFLKELKKALYNEYAVGKISSGIPKINYFLASEYGKKGAPHYHMFLGCHSSVPQEKLLNLIIKFWCGWNDHNGQIFVRYGFVFPRIPYGDKCKNEYGQIVQLSPFKIESIEKSANYVSKYVCKDLDFYNQPVIQNYIDYLKTQIKTINVDLPNFVDFDYYMFEKLTDVKLEPDLRPIFLQDETILFECKGENERDYPSIYSELKRYLPFKLVSRHFGLSLCERAKGSTDEETAKNLLRGYAVPSKDKVLYMPYPRYILRKMLFDTRYFELDGKKYVRYDLNSLGITYKTWFYEDVKQDFINRKKRIYTLMMLNDKTLSYSQKQLFKNVNWEYYYIYCTTYCNVVFPHLLDRLFGDRILFHDFYNYVPSELIELSKQAIRYSVIRKKGLELKNADIAKAKYNHMLFNEHSLFKNFDLLTQKLNDYERNLSKLKKEKKFKSQNSSQLLRDNYFNFINYV